jgi:hypothetical protein
MDGTGSDAVLQRTRTQIGTNDKVVQRILATFQATRDQGALIKPSIPLWSTRYIKMQATVDALKPWPVNGQQIYSQIAGKLQKQNAGEVAEWPNAAVC